VRTRRIGTFTFSPLTFVCFALDFFLFLSYFRFAVAIAILSGYGGLIVLYKIYSAVSGGGKKEEVVAIKPAKVEAVTTGVPSIESPAFEKFVETDAFEKLLENEEQLNKLLA
jgi:hypothetical protein